MLSKMAPSRHEKANFWTAIAAVVAVLGAGLAGVAAKELPSTATFWSSGWAKGAAALWILAAVAVAVALGIRYQDWSEGREPGGLQRVLSMEPTLPASRAPRTPSTNSTMQTPLDLWKLIKGITDLQAQALLAPVVGKLMTISGKVDSVGGIGGTKKTLVIIRPDGLHHIALVFNERWHSELAMMKIGDPMTAKGSFVEADNIKVRLRDCEIL